MSGRGIVHTVEIARRPEEVFAYLTDDLSRHREWQTSVRQMRVEPAGPARRGSKVFITRRVGPRERTFTSEITEVTAPRTYAFRGIDGPVRAIGRDTIEPILDGTRSRVTSSLDFEGVGIGKLLIPFVRRRARRELPVDYTRLKEHLEKDVVAPRA